MSLNEKRTGKSTPRERSGKHGTPIDGIASPVTPHNSKTIRTGTPEGGLRTQPGYNEDPFVLNPGMKGFLRAETDRSSNYFKAKAINTVPGTTYE